MRWIEGGMRAPHPAVAQSKLVEGKFMLHSGFYIAGGRYH
jgi:hypothetical protein